jgi:uncharacterized protein
MFRADQSPCAGDPSVLVGSGCMEINVGQIKEDEGLTLSHRYEEGEPRLGGDDSRLIGQTGIEARITRDGEKVRLTGRLEAAVEINCDRCLKPLTVPVEQSFDLLYVPPLRAGGANDEKELGTDDLDVGFYQGQTIELDDVVREQIELALPMTRLCADDCQGLCSECGVNLNEGECGCATKQTDPRWDALKGLKISD